MLPRCDVSEARKGSHCHKSDPGTIAYVMRNTLCFIDLWIAIDVLSRWKSVGVCAYDLGSPEDPIAEDSGLDGQAAWHRPLAFDDQGRIGPRAAANRCGKAPGRRRRPASRAPVR